MAAAVKLTCLACGQVNRVPGERLGMRPKCGSCGTPLVSADPAEIDLATLERAARSDDLPLLVDFWASWCGPCRAMAPEFARAAQALKGRARFAKVNTEHHPDAAIRYQIRGIPALILFVGGGETARSAGARPTAQIEAFVREKAALGAQERAGRDA